MLGCPSCQGKLLLRNQAQQLVVNELGIPPAEVTVALAQPGPRRLPCGSCGGVMAQVRLRGVHVDLCGQCGAMWFERGLIEMLTHGKRTEPTVQDPSVASSPAAPVPPAQARARPTALGTAAPARSRGPLLAGAAVACALILGAGVWMWSRTGSNEKSQRREALSDRAFYERYAAYFSHHTFGGRSCDWWADRLAALSPKGAEANAKLLTLALERAKAAGLTVQHDAAGQWRVTPNEQTVAALVERTGAR